MSMTTSLNPKEIEHFSKDSPRWWDENGPFRPLHRLGSVRLRYLRDRITGHFGLDADRISPFADLKILDVGCGGGLVCEPLARLGANVTGIDADENAIAVAKDHAAGMGLKINYLSGTAENLLSSSPRRKPGSTANKGAGRTVDSGFAGMTAGEDSTSSSPSRSSSMSPTGIFSSGPARICAGRAGW